MERAMIENMDKALINELSQGKELVEQLMNQSSSQEKRVFLVAQIISSYEKSILMLNRTNPKISALESPHSFDHQEKNSSPVNVSKRRKAMARGSEQIKVCLGTGVEGALEDGYSWRKYGQKVILGSSHPRGYYRCTYRHSQGCLATKQVQRSDQDTSIFEVTYKGRHTCCTRSSHQPIVSASLSQQGLTQQSANFLKLKKIEKTPTHSQSNLLDLKASLQVKTEDLDTVEGNIFLPSSFSSSSTESETLDNLFLSEADMESGFGAEFSLPFSSPTDSDSNYLSDLSEIISLPTSPVGDSYYSDVKIDNVDFRFNFDFDSAEFFY